MNEQTPRAVGDTPFRSSDPAATTYDGPKALIGPVSGVIGRTNEILNSRVVEPSPSPVSIEWRAPCNYRASWQQGGRARFQPDLGECLAALPSLRRARSLPRRYRGRVSRLSC